MEHTDAYVTQAHSALHGKPWTRDTFEQLVSQANSLRDQVRLDAKSTPKGDDSSDTDDSLKLSLLGGSLEIHTDTVHIFGVSRLTFPGFLQKLLEPDNFSEGFLQLCKETDKANEKEQEQLLALQQDLLCLFGLEDPLLQVGFSLALTHCPVRNCGSAS